MIAPAAAAATGRARRRGCYDFLSRHFVRLAESFGAAGRRADGPEQLREALRWALRLDAPALIDVPVDPMPDMWPVLRPGYRG